MAGEDRETNCSEELITGIGAIVRSNAGIKLPSSSTEKQKRNPRTTTTGTTRRSGGRRRLSTRTSDEEQMRIEIAREENEGKVKWVPDKLRKVCKACGTKFTTIRRQVG